MAGPEIIEPLSAQGWPAADRAHLGGWRLHASAGHSGRINSCWPLAAPDRSVEEAIAAVEAWYAARGQPPRFKLAGDAVVPSDLEARLIARGYASYTPTLTMVGPLAGATEGGVRIETEPSPAFGALFTDPSFGDATDAQERLAALARVPAPRGFAVMAAGGETAAIGVCVVQGDWAGMMTMRTAPAQRRQGLGRRVFRALAGFARAAGANNGYLQVEAANASAIALYRSEVFADAYLYRYWIRR